MKKVFTFISILLFFSAFIFAQDFNEPKPAETDTENLEDVEFINYTGPNDVIDSVSAIRAIGAELGKPD